jgi:uncharacterized metal-binding protein
MPGVRTHDSITLITAAGADIAYFTQAPHPDPNLAVLFTAAYLFAGYACAGDLDLQSAEYRRWGPLRFLWWPYQKLIPHRSPLSHGLVVGGIIRVLYLATACTLLFWVVLWLLSRLGPHVNADAVTKAEWASLFSLAHAHPQWTLALLAGFILAGTTHSLADALSTWFKRRF